MTDTPVDADQVKQAVQAYVYGYPLVYCLDEIAKLPAGTSIFGVPLPLNTFHGATELLGPDAEFVTPNNDTLYLMAGLDLTGGPLVLDVPATDGRYYVLQFVDAWSNNVAYVGTRATGNDAGTFLVTPPGYAGAVPEGVAVVEVPTTTGVIVGRIAVAGPDDVPAVVALQGGFSLAPAPGNTATTGAPRPAAGVAEDLLFWEKLRVALGAFAPADTDAEFLANAAAFGLTDAGSPFVDPDPALAAVLVAARAQGADLIDELGRTVITPVNGWTSAMHAFDFNLDHLGLGTIDAPEWKIADRTTAYVTRAVAARLGLWGNHGYEANYDILWTDQDDRTLDGSHRYELVLPGEPPTGAFWSLTMYDSPNYYLVDNPIDRYQIGDRTPGLEIGDDGTVTIRLQVDSPGPDLEANWLPAPPGPFRPVLRNYLPQAPVLDGSYVLPHVRRLD